MTPFHHHHHPPPQSCHGLEARTPFLDKQFVAAFLSMPTALRRPLRDGPAGPRMEKQLLREGESRGGRVGSKGGVKCASARIVLTLPVVSAALPRRAILRAAFDDADDPLLPPDVLWRRKEAFSDGVSHVSSSCRGGGVKRTGWRSNATVRASSQAALPLFSYLPRLSRTRSPASRGTP